MKEKYLFTRDSKGSVRVVHLYYEKLENPDRYIIKRSSGIWGKKITEQPEIVITKGKVKRTLLEQVQLEYAAYIKKYKDKGYKSLKDLKLNSVDDFDPELHLPKEVTDQNGNKKPMLCKVYDPNDPKVQNKTYYASRKHDGLRCHIYMKDGVLRTSSRGGQNYNTAAYYILTDAFIINLLKNNPGMVLDGELYKHGWNLQKISGLGRLETLHKDHRQLRFYCYDIVDESKTFNERLEILKTIKPSWNSLLTIVDHVKVSSEDEINKLHDEWINEGYEGLVLRDPDMTYKCGARDRRMMKVKKFVDGEFTIKGLAEGLRDEDLCFIMETDDGNEFKAKPIGDRALKQWYRENIDSLINKKGTVKYFGFTETENPVPNLPVFKSVRIDKDIDE